PVRNVPLLNGTIPPPNAAQASMALWIAVALLPVPLETAPYVSGSQGLPVMTSAPTTVSLVVRTSKSTKPSLVASAVVDCAPHVAAASSDRAIAERINGARDPVIFHVGIDCGDSECDFLSMSVSFNNVLVIDVASLRQASCGQMATRRKWLAPAVMRLRFP